MILFFFGINSSPKVTSTGELGRLLDWFIDGLFVDVVGSFYNVLHEFVSVLIGDDINGD